MSRPQKIHPPIKGAFNNILAAVAAGAGAGRDAAKQAGVIRSKPPKQSPSTPKKP